MRKKQTAKSHGPGRKTHNKIDVTGIFSKPVKVGKNGREQSMTPFEVAFRAQVKKAVKEQSLNAIKRIPALAVEYEIVAQPPEIKNGGVRLSPLRPTA